MDPNRTLNPLPPGKSKPRFGQKSASRQPTRAITLGEWTENLARELERAGRERTARAYRGAALRFTRFLNDDHPAAGTKTAPVGTRATSVGARAGTRPAGQIELQRISGALIGAFQIELRLEGRAPNTISFYMRMLRSVLNKAVACGVVPMPATNLFSGVYTGVAQTRKRALTARELGRMAAMELPDPQLDDARALFMFGYHARGMSFVDVAHLKKSDIRGRTIRYTRRKTGRVIELSIQPAMRKIIDRFAARTRTSEYVFPIIRDASRSSRPQYENALRRQNVLLKELGRLAGIDHGFSTHSARHSWATMARNYGLPLAVISEGLGHSSQRTTEIYLASIEQGVLDRASKMISDAITRPKPPRQPRTAFEMVV